MSGIGIISNPHAKVNRIDPEHNTLIWYVLGNKGQFEVTNTLDDLATVCENFCRQNVTHVGIIGGDGTVTRTLNALVKAYGTENLPKILLLRGGTVNVLATNLGLYGKPKDILADFLDFFHSSNPLHEMVLRSLYVNENLGFLLGTGGAVKFLDAFYKNKTSAAGAAKFFTRIVADGLLGGHLTGEYNKLSETEDMIVSVSFKGESSTMKLSSALMLASSIPKIPYGFEYFPDLATTNQFAEAIAGEWPQKKVAAEVIKSLLYKNKNNANLTRIRFEEMNIKFAKPSSYTLDGEIFKAKDKTINIKLGPLFRFCSPYGKVLE